MSTEFAAAMNASYLNSEVLPLEPELAQMATLKDAQDWVGIEKPLADALTKALGRTTLFRHVATVPRGAWEAAVGPPSASKLQVPGTPPTGGGQQQQPGSPTYRPFRPIEVGMVELYRAVVRMKCNLPPNEGPTGGAQVPATTGGGGLGCGGPTATAPAATSTGIDDWQRRGNATAKFNLGSG